MRQQPVLQQSADRTDNSEVEIMSSKMSEQDLYRPARKRVEEKKGFYIHFAVYLAVNALLVVIWFVTGHPGNRFPWLVFPLGGWGIRVLFHLLGVSVFLFSVIAAYSEYELTYP